MSLIVSGLNHHTSPVELREPLAFPARTLPTALAEAHNALDQAGVVILSTCNRVEVYAHHDQLAPAKLHEGVRSFLATWHQIAEDTFGGHLYEHEGQQAVGHLFRVASSLDSMVVGEPQVLGQVHDAYLAAQAAQTTNKVLNALFQRAFSVAKRVRSESGIGAGKVSISSVAVDLAASIFMELSGKTVLVVGSGEMAELTLRSLSERGAGTVLVANRSPEKARVLADSCGGEAVAFGDLPAHLHLADIIISSTAAPHFVLHPQHFETALRNRDQAPMFVIDIAVPRDVDPAVAELDNVYLYDVDDLEAVVAENVKARRDEIDRCLALVDDAVRQFGLWKQGLAAEPTILSVSEELNAIREEELAKSLAALPDLTDDQRQEVRYLTERLVKRILQRPMKEIKQEIGHHDPGIVLHLVRRIFGLGDNR